MKLPVFPQLGPCEPRTVITFRKHCNPQATGLWEYSIKCWLGISSDCVKLGGEEPSGAL